MSLRAIVEIEWDVLSNLETGKSFVVAITLHHAFCCVVQSRLNLIVSSSCPCGGGCDVLECSYDCSTVDYCV